jgi:hypothetical protein
VCLFVFVTMSLFIKGKGEYLLIFYLCDNFISRYLIVFWLSIDVILRKATLRAILPCSVYSETVDTRLQINVWWS